MRRLAFLLACAALLVFAASLGAQHGEGASGSGHGESGAAHTNVTAWKWANFVLLGGALGYLIYKNAPAFFLARSEAIRQGLDEAQKLKAKAEAESAAVEARLKQLEQDIAALRASAHQETASEAERARARTQQELAKVQLRAEEEISSAANSAQTELRRYAADLALELAKQMIQQRMGPGDQEHLIHSFARDLGRLETGGQSPS